MRRGVRVNRAQYVRQLLPRRARYQPSSSWSTPHNLLVVVKTEDYKHREMARARAFLMLEYVSLEKLVIIPIFNKQFSLIHQSVYLQSPSVECQVGICFQEHVIFSLNFDILQGV